MASMGGQSSPPPWTPFSPELFLQSWQNAKLGRGASPPKQGTSSVEGVPCVVPPAPRSPQSQSPSPHKNSPQQQSDNPPKSPFDKNTTSRVQAQRFLEFHRSEFLRVTASAITVPTPTTEPPLPEELGVLERIAASDALPWYDMLSDAELLHAANSFLLSTNSLGDNRGPFGDGLPDSPLYGDKLHVSRVLLETLLPVYKSKFPAAGEASCPEVQIFLEKPESLLRGVRSFLWGSQGYSTDSAAKVKGCVLDCRLDATGWVEVGEGSAGGAGGGQGASSSQQVRVEKGLVVGRLWVTWRRRIYAEWA